ncbi:MAG: tryptophan-rich sensory protein [Clostridia bacterium]|nr:tryptophan-rich sensory protein [Clostridia bacterium]
MTERAKKYLSFAFAAAAAGALETLALRKEFGKYAFLALPSFAPRGAVLIAAWTVSLSLAGAGCAGAYVSFFTLRERALFYYALQFISAAAWPFAFFALENYRAACITAVFVLFCACKAAAITYKSNKAAALLQLPHIAWVSFCTALCVTAALMN